MRFRDCCIMPSVHPTGIVCDNLANATDISLILSIRPCIMYSVLTSGFSRGKDALGNSVWSIPHAQGKGTVQDTDDISPHTMPPPTHYSGGLVPIPCVQLRVRIGTFGSTGCYIRYCKLLVDS